MVFLKSQRISVVGVIICNNFYWSMKCFSEELDSFIWDALASLSDLNYAQIL
jgi:hypothetical protein